MAYVPFDPAVPDVSTDTRKEAIDNARTNLTALADILASMGWMDEFDVTISAGTADVPTEILATNGVQVVKIGITYGSGATAGLPTVIVLSKSVNSGGAYDSVRTATISYDGSANFVSLVWT